MQYKYKCFWIEIVDLVEEDLYDKRYPTDLYKYNIYYNGTCCETGTRISAYHCEQAAEHWVREYGFEWLGLNYDKQTYYR